MLLNDEDNTKRNTCGAITKFEDLEDCLSFLGVSEPTIRRRLKKWGLESPWNQNIKRRVQEERFRLIRQIFHDLGGSL